MDTLHCKNNMYSVFHLFYFERSGYAFFKKDLNLVLILYSSSLSREGVTERLNEMILLRNWKDESRIKEAILDSIKL